MLRTRATDCVALSRGVVCQNDRLDERKPRYHGAAMETNGLRYQDRITADPNILVGKPTIRGTRIAVEHVLQQLADEPDVAILFEVFPDLTVEDVRACLEY